MANEKRLIDANPIVQFIMDGLNNPDKMKALGHDAIEILTEIEYAPTVEAVEVVHGRWEDSYGGKYANPRFRCSVCKEKALYKFERDCLGNHKDVQALTPICPYCSARLDGGKANDI